MQDNSKFDELLVSYLSGELSEEDESFVVQWIEFDVKNRLYFEKIQRVWRLLSLKTTEDQIDINQEWSHIKQVINKKKLYSPAPEPVKATAYSLLDEKVPQSKEKLFRLLVPTAVAASIVVVIAFFSGFFENNSQVKSFSGRLDRKIDTLSTSLRHEVNRSGKPRRLMLNDGSEITLSPNSELSYDDPFAANRRHLTLKGEAYFNVIKDRSKPFTVFSGHLSTTALGTHFRVMAFEDANNITVRLYEGKVVVKPDAALKAKLVTDFYLLPGQELVYDNNSSTARLRNFLVPAKTGSADQAAPETEHGDLPDLPVGQKGTWFMFNNQSLESVFEQLKIIYDVKIVYAKRDVQRRYFIRKFEKCEPVERILEEITMLNDLKLVKKNDTFYIKK
jgi:transmembrane sensor